MLARFALVAIGLGAAAVQIAAPFPARAQCRLCTAPTTAPADEAVRKPVDLEVEASLDFDKLILIAPGEGTATLRPDGSRHVSGTLGAMGARAMVGQVRVRGEPGRTVRIDLPRRIELYSLRGGRVTIEEIVSDLPSLPRLDSAGTLGFRFGGQLRVSGDAEGEYRGDVPITVEYL